MIIFVLKKQAVGKMYNFGVALIDGEGVSYDMLFRLMKPRRAVGRHLPPPPPPLKCYA